MCIAIYSGPGVPMPTKEVLKRCYRNNPDGAGFAYLTPDDTWVIRKGLQTWGAFWKAYESMEFEKGHTVALHFRVGTAGHINEDGTCYSGCTHPFPITENTEDLMELAIESENIIMHNGVVGKGNGWLSDTQEAILDYAEPLLPYIENPKILDILTEVLDAGPTGSRWFVATKDQVHLLGKWIEDKDTKIQYSNDGYLSIEECWTAWQNLNPQYKKGYNGVHTAGSTTYKLDYKVADPVLYEHEVFSWDCCSGGSFDWDKFSEIEKIVKSAGRNEVKEDNLSTGNMTHEIFDINNKLIGIVDPDGTSTWLNESKESYSDLDKCICTGCAVILRKEEELESGGCPVCGSMLAVYSKEYTCTDCSAPLRYEDLNEHYNCPFCTGQVARVSPWEDDKDGEIIEADEYEEDEHVNCPECYEDKYIFPSEKSDNECLTCGAHYSDAGEVVYIDGQVRKLFTDEQMKESLGRDEAKEKEVNNQYRAAKGWRD
jgi:hypothetical protein